jgi:hypothetical protein
MPYYMKIQEYLHVESRDLWEYELTFDEEQAARLVAHVWETRTTHFDYYFFSENCSYFLLGLLEVADPELRLVERFPGAVIPTNTVRAVLEVPGLVRARSLRPSLRATLEARSAGLSRSEAKLVAPLASGKSGKTAQLATLSRERQAAVLDTSLDLLRLREGKQLRAEEPDSVGRERSLLLLRGRTGVPPSALAHEVSAQAPPETGHRSLRLVAGGGARATRTATGHDQAALIDVAVRFAMHDELDDPQGYPPDSLLEKLQVRLRIEPARRRVWLERLDAVHIVATSPITRWSLRPSWQVWAGAQQAHELGCAGAACTYGGARGGSGLAVRPWRPLLLQAMALSDVAGGPAFAAGYRLGLAASFLPIWPPRGPGAPPRGCGPPPTAWGSERCTSSPTSPRR